MKRLYYLTKSIQSAENVALDLHKTGVSDWNFHVMSQCNESGLYRRNIHSANTIHKTDIIHGAERGSIAGLFGGLLLAWYISIESLVGFQASLGALLFATLFGVLLGGWLGGFVGIQSENYKIHRFHDHLKQGHFLIMVDVQSGEEQKLQEVMSYKHPEVIYCDDDSTLILPFQKESELKLG